MSEQRTVTGADIEAKLRQIRQSVTELIQGAQQQAQQLAKKAAAPAGSALVVLAYLRRRRKKRRTLIEVRRA
jgi:F0F1-type ATP synthase membrane subunit b/b'